MKRLLFIAVVGLMFSCTNNNFDENYQESKELSFEEFTLKAIYEGKKYEVPCLLDNKNDSIIYLDDEFANLMYNVISKNDRLVTKIHDDGYIEYAVFSQSMDSINHSIITRGISLDPEIIGLTYLQFWDDTHFEDRNYIIGLDPRNKTSWDCPRLTDFHNFNDKISSLKIVNINKDRRPNVYFQGFQDINYGGHVLEYAVGTKCYAAYPPVDEDLIEIPSLKKVPMAGGKNWNDRLSSIKFFYGRK